MSDVRIPRNGANAIPLGGTRRLVPPFAVRIDVMLYNALDIVRDSRKADAPYYIKSLGKDIQKALEPWYPTIPPPGDPLIGGPS